MGSKLSHELLARGFFSALGTAERRGESQVASYVPMGQPYTYDYNNGVLVVYDENKWPWIVRSTGDLYPKVISNIRSNLKGHELRQGAHVPHSNDGGNFVIRVLPMLLEKPGVDIEL